ncbi:MAG: hypothetical protein JSW50_00025, partial [Candidatus Latescibacterota bacterium]
MKTLLLLTCIVILSANLAFAQGGVIVFFGDPGGTDCNLWDNVTGLCLYYVFHFLHGGATASQFSATKPACFGAMWLNDTSVFTVKIGDSQSGVAIGYGQCMPAPTHILTINYFCQATTGSCSEYRAGPYPAVASGKIEVVDCNDNLIYGDAICSV